MKLAEVRNKMVRSRSGDMYYINRNGMVALGSASSRELYEVAITAITKELEQEGFDVLD